MQIPARLASPHVVEVLITKMFSAISAIPLEHVLAEQSFCFHPVISSIYSYKFIYTANDRIKHTGYIMDVLCIGLIILCSN